MSVLPIENLGIEIQEITYIEGKETVCRYCLESNGNNKINPCNCKNFVHKECLIKWLLIKKNDTCEICKKKYKNLNTDIEFQLFYKKIDEFIQIIFRKFRIDIFLIIFIIIVIIYLFITCSIKKNCGNFSSDPSKEPTYLPTSK